MSEEVVGEAAGVAGVETMASNEGDDLIPVLEAILFASHEPLTARRISHALPGIATARVSRALSDLAESLSENRSPLQLVEMAGGFRLVTRPEFAPYLARLFHKSEKERLSPAALETLAIVAYRQPITRADIEGIRGVQASPVLRSLQERKLIKVVGRAPVVGRPQQYGTTKKFLDHFGLAELEQLPALFGDEGPGSGLSAELSVPDLDVDPDDLEDPLEEVDGGDDAAAVENSPHAAGSELEALDAAEQADFECSEEGEDEEGFFDEEDPQAESASP